MTPEEIAWIVELHRHGKSQFEIADLVGRTQSYISVLLKREGIVPKRGRRPKKRIRRGVWEMTDACAITGTLFQICIRNS